MNTDIQSDVEWEYQNSRKCKILFKIKGCEEVCQINLLNLLQRGFPQGRKKKREEDEATFKKKGAVKKSQGRKKKTEEDETVFKKKGAVEKSQGRRKKKMKPRLRRKEQWKNLKE